jgi:hypothetical protein
LTKIFLFLIGGVYNTPIFVAEFTPNKDTVNMVLNIQITKDHSAA